MELGWKIMLPVALAYIVVVATTVWILDELGVALGIPYGLALFGVNLVLAAVLLWGVDRGRLIAGSRRRVGVPA